MKRILFSMFIILAFSIVRGQTQDKGNNSKIKTTGFKVEGMTCRGCVAHVESSPDKVDGITEKQVSLKEGKAEIKYDPAKTDEQEIEAALKSTGYKISRIENKPNNK